MNTRQKIAKGGFMVVGNQSVILISRFLRNIIIARILSPEDFGLGVLFAITISFLEMVSDAGFERMLVQAKDGDDPKMQANAQTMILGRGILIGVFIVLLAPFISHLFQAPNLTLAFTILAGVPVIKGLTHLDLVRLQRNFRFGPWAKAQMVASILTTIAAWPLVLWCQDYTVFLWVAWIQVSLDILLSHVFSIRKYQLSLDLKLATRFYHFGWPLLINNLFLYGILNGDKFIIGSVLPDKTYLAFYAIAFGLAMMPARVILQACSSLLLPVLARVQDERESYLKRYRFTSQSLHLIAGSLAILLILSGALALQLFYGDKYSEAAVLVGWFGAMQAVRLVREAPIKASTARGDTQNTMISNLFRSSSLVVAFWVITNGYSLVWLAVAGFAAELLALLVSTLTLKIRHQVDLSLIWKPMIWMMSSLGLAALVLQTQIIQGGWVGACAITLILIGAYVVLGYLMFSEVNQTCNPILVRFWKKGFLFGWKPNLRKVSVGKEV